jgi:hypothetical protein
VIILGMHRSGTSAVARVLSLLGADLPRNLMAPAKGNPKGHWEPERIVGLHDEILAEVASSWQDVTRFPTDWYGSAREPVRRAEMSELLRDEYGDSPLFVLKDPRMCRLVPFWLDVMAEAEVNPSFTIVVRNPLEVAASLKDRDGLSFHHGLLLWLRHVIDAERDTRGHPRAFISYARLLSDWEREAQSVAQQLGISWPRLSHRTRVQVDEFLSTRDRHHEASAEDLAAHSAVVSWVVQTYEALERASEFAEAPLGDVIDEVAAELDTADASFGPLLANLTEQLARKDDELDHALRSKSDDLEHHREALEWERGKRADAEEKLAGALEEREELDGELSRSVEDRKRLEESLTVSRTRADALDAELARFREQALQLEAVRGTLARAERELAQACAARDDLRRQVKSREGDLRASMSELEERASAEDRLRTEVQSLDRELSRLHAEVQSLRDETALQYFQARPASKASSFKHLMSWLLPLPRATGRRYLRTFLALRRVKEFDYAYYLTTYPDVALSGRQALMHYIEHGVAEGRDPSRSFNTRSYLATHPGLLESGENPLLHYVRGLRRQPGAQS